MVYVAALAGIGVNNFHRTNLALHDVHWCMLAYPDGTNASTKLPWSSQGAHSGRCKCNAAPIKVAAGPWVPQCDSSPTDLARGRSAA